MKSFSFFLSSLVVSATMHADPLPFNLETASIVFTENKGQVSDQFYKSRSDVLFCGQTRDIVFHLRNNGISYQLNKTETWREINLKNEKRTVPDQKTIYRVDINWLNCNRDIVVQRGEVLPGYNNYYLPACLNGIRNVESYTNVIYKNIYSGIDLKWHSKENNLKYEYYLSPNADYKQIRFEIKGAEKINVTETGELLIGTPLGNIIENAPYVTQLNKVLKSRWVISGNIISFEIENLNHAEAFVIDPELRAWGTWYGGSGQDNGYGCSADTLGNVFMCGWTNSSNGTSIATVGSHQSTIDGSADAFIVKFSPGGIRRWGTYYGGSAGEYGYACSSDINCNVFLTGVTGSSVNGIASIGAFQATYGGDNNDAFLVKFDSLGVRQWGTYYGGPGLDYAYACATDISGNVYISGQTAGTGTEIASPGSHQDTYAGGDDAFLAKFDPNGSRIWGTYYGGVFGEQGWACTTDKAGNVFLGGTAASYTNSEIATLGSHQYISAGADAFLVKFNASGIRQWGTYYGGSGSDIGSCCAADTTGNIYLSGYSSSTTGTGVATPSSHQPTFGGGTYDAYLVKFNSQGVRQWGTYYGGGANLDYGWSCATDIRGDVYLGGQTGSSVGIVMASPNGHQPIYGGFNCDAFLSKFNSNGLRIAATYYGSLINDIGFFCCVDQQCNSFVTGESGFISGTVIATDGSHQPSPGGAVDGFLVKFWACPPFAPINNTPVSNQTICAGASTSLVASGSGTLNWYATSTSTTLIGMGSVYYTPTLSAGTYTYYAEALTCTTSLARTPVTVTVIGVPLNISATATLICEGQSVVLTASGATTYTWNTGPNSNSISVTPSITTSFSVTGTNTITGCQQTAIISIQVNTCTSLSSQFVSAAGVRVHPNPNEGEFEIEFKNSSNKIITVYDTFGRIIYSAITNEEKIKITIKEFSSGIYYVKTQDADSLNVIKVIKE
jgi:hypothetical protein